jgi:1-acyl-sn-glycerol-3-phosphate acyltransferase
MDIINALEHFCIEHPWLVGGSAVFLAWVAFWNVQGWLLSHRSGHFAPRLSCAPQLVRYFISSLIGRWFIGKLRVHGWENLDGVSGNVIIGPNHQREADVFLVGMGLGKRAVRLLMAINQTAGFFRAPFFAWMGAISVGYSKENRASAAADSAVEALGAEASRGKNTALIIFPQGTLIRDDNWDRKQFFKGLMKISRMARERTGQDYWIVPVVAQYNYDSNLGSRFQRLVRWLRIPRKFFGRTIYGATIYIAKPLLRSSLPEDDEAAMDVYYEVMLAARARCREMCNLHATNIDSDDGFC